MVDNGIKLKERDYLEDLGFDSYKLLMWILVRQDLGFFLDSAVSECGRMADHCEHGNGTSGFIGGGGGVEGIS